MIAMTDETTLRRAHVTVMGIDPGLGTTGWAIVSGETDTCALIAAGTIRTDPHADMAERLLVISNRVRELVQTHNPADVAIEDIFLAKDARAAFALGQARGAAMVGAALADRAVYSYTALQVKQSVTGNGRASKQQVGFMVRNMLNLKEELQPADKSDAAAVALCHWSRKSLVDERNGWSSLRPGKAAVKAGRGGI
jgi:crossover junction endodeoxyribonuclease RuvC